MVLKCYKRDIQYLEPIIFIQEYKEKPEVDTITLDVIDGESIKYKLIFIGGLYVFVFDHDD